MNILVSSLFAAVIALEAPFGKFTVSEPVIPARDFAITDYGAKAGEKSTAAFASAIKAAHSAGGGRVVVPKGEWVTGAIHLRSGVELHLEPGSVIAFTDDPADYPVVHTTWEGVECMNYSPLVYAYGCTNVAITGSGTLAPTMTGWRKWFARPPAHMFATECLYHWGSTNAVMSARDVTKIPGSNVRPHLLQINRSANVLLDGFKIRESPFWTIHLYHSENCIVRKLDVFAHGHNNDGVDIDMTKNTLVENCRFDQGDDGIVLKAGRNQDAWRLARPTENVVVRNCEFVAGHTLLGIGSELSGGVRNVWVTNCRMDYCFRLCYVKTNHRRGGVIENIWMDNVKSRIASSALFAIGTDVIYQWAKFPDYEVKYTKIRNIHLKDIHGESANWMFEVKGDAHSPVEGLHFENLSLDSVKKGFANIVNAKGVEMKNVALGTGEPPPRCLFFAGDSTLDDCGESGAIGGGYKNRPHRSWGTALKKHMRPGCTVRNFAQSGASTSSFIVGGRWAKLMGELKPGDFVAIQFGHNDQKWSNDFYRQHRFCHPEGAFRDNVRRFVNEVRTRGARVILLSPIVRGTFGKDGRLADKKDKKGINLGSYAVAMKELAEELQVPYVDMNRLTRECVEKAGPEGSKKFYVISTGWKRAQDGEPAKDVTHPVGAGAETFSQLFLQDVKARKLSVGAMFK